ncbi:MAG: site-2 protease family protein [Gammaproteobacteria bacterium]|nr:site-2 protease family protein [Gammaproteobacteria bacterium]
MEILSTTQKIAVWVVPILLAVTVHETAHGWAAKQLGDRTAMMLGRLTLNPIKHIDPIGTLLLPMLMLLMGGFVFGWAKPVPVTWENLRNPKRDMAFVALAGPLANLGMAILWVLVVHLGFWLVDLGSSTGRPLVYMGGAGMVINVVLMVLNLVPLPPLDGGRVVVSLLPNRLSWKYSRIEPYGMWIILALFFTGMLGMILWPFILGVETVLCYAGQIPLDVFDQIVRTISPR